MSILLYLALWTVPLVVGYFVIRLTVRHGIMDAHRRLHTGEIAEREHFALTISGNCGRFPGGGCC